ncbi:hypothetical protein OC709_02225 ['Planchonia careya' phytoplasma]|nr:hypothetical protein ['Planchonia careya' phytoplasma]MDO8030315.1 hypothetical protein ['Planchonia careya' phytoplasma]
MNGDLFGYDVGYLVYLKYLTNFVSYSISYIYSFFMDFLKSSLELLLVVII